MKYRKLRIAWSVGWGLACYLLVGMWAMSYEYHGVIQPTAKVAIWSSRGNIILGQFEYLAEPSADMDSGVGPKVWGFRIPYL